jgi:hypothetical protein
MSAFEVSAEESGRQIEVKALEQEGKGLGNQCV